MSRFEGVGAALLIAIVAVAVPRVGWVAEDSDQAVATMKIRDTRIEWRPRIDYQGIRLTVSGQDRTIQKEFAAGEPLELDLREGPFRELPDGSYTYELNAAPKVEEALRQRLAEARESGDPAVIEALRKEGALPQGPFTQSGSFSVKGGALVDRELQEPGAVHQRPEEPKFKSGGDLVVWGDLSVRGLLSRAVLDPKDAKRSIHFAALEGPEVGIYYRGSARLSGAEAVIKLPEHFAKLADERGLTVQLTPVGGWSQLYVAEKSPRRLLIRQAAGGSAVEFDFLVQGIRKQDAEFRVERNAAEDPLLFPGS